jgi:hypothetical protein
MSVVLGPLILVAVWVQTFRVWRRGADVSAGIAWATGPASIPGYHASLLPSALLITVEWLGIILLELESGVASMPGWVGAVASWLMGVGLIFLVLAFWVWLFMRPRLLVPPHLRGQPGWVAGLRRQRRAARGK